MLVTFYRMTTSLAPWFLLHLPHESIQLQHSGDPLVPAFKRCAVAAIRTGGMRVDNAEETRQTGGQSWLHTFWALRMMEDESFGGPSEGRMALFLAHIWIVVVFYIQAPCQ
jgi:hypothetical protein